MPWIPSFPGERPTLGYYVIDWIAANLAAPDRADYEPLTLYGEQETFVERFYELHPRTGRRRYRRAVLSRPRGWGKSPFAAALCWVEALADVLFDHWAEEGETDGNGTELRRGEPVGKPWADVRTPLVQIAAVSDVQARTNTWPPLLEMGRYDAPLHERYPGVELMDTFVSLPRGKIEPVTTSARSIKGARACFAILDQTEVWVPSVQGPTMAETMRINAGKIGGSTLETPNAFTPGEGSVAELSAQYWAMIREGTARDSGLFYDHVEAPPETDLADRDSLLAGLAVVYGDSAQEKGGHVDLERILAEIWDPSTPPQRSRADFLNQITHAQDSWIAAPEWAAAAAPERVVADGEQITLGFDGSRSRAHGVTDATALIGCRVSDGHLFSIGVWEQPDGPLGEDWRVPVQVVQAAVEHAFDRYRVVGFYADPAKWESYVADWEARHGGVLKVKASREHPIEWWMLGGGQKVVEAVRQFHDALLDQDLSHDGSYALTRHALNARIRYSRSGASIGKEFPESARKIDAVVAAILAWQARLDAVAAGVVQQEAEMFIPRRVR